MTRIQSQAEVVAGTDVDIKQHQYVVAIVFFCELVGNGVILAERWILSTASMFYHIPHTKYSVATGTDHYPDQATWYEVDCVYKHPFYNGLDDNIALVSIEGAIEYTERVKPIALTYISDHTDTLAAEMLWYGTSVNKTIQLRKVTFILTSDQSCVDQLSDQVAKHIITDRAGYCMMPEQGTYRAQWYNASGAPIVVNNELHAIFSFNENDGGAVATRLWHYRPWMMSVSNTLFKVVDRSEEERSRERPNEAPGV
uniref:Peptidase S1 domain-containing protein n=1 Tax=Anopheles maculatus TaxID=74869 RepID=A0A182SKQ1_9DIPT